MNIPAISVGDVRSYNTSFGSRANKKNSNVNNNQATSSVPTSLKAIPLATLIALSPLNSNVYASEKAMMASEDAMIEMVAPDTTVQRKTQDKITMEDVDRYSKYEAIKTVETTDVIGLFQVAGIIFRTTEGMPDAKKDDPEILIQLVLGNRTENEKSSRRSAVSLYPTKLTATKDNHYFATGLGYSNVLDKRVDPPEQSNVRGPLTVQISKVLFECLRDCFDGDIPINYNVDIKEFLNGQSQNLAQK